MGEFGNYREEQRETLLIQTLRNIRFPASLWSKSAEEKREYLTKEISRITGEKRLSRLIPLRNAVLRQVDKRD
jgi:hypothetical protein